MIVQKKAADRFRPYHPADHGHRSGPEAVGKAVGFSYIPTGHPDGAILKRMQPTVFIEGEASGMNIASSLLRTRKGFHRR